jgi:hypothetical protein
MEEIPVGILLPSAISHFTCFLSKLSHLDFARARLCYCHLLSLLSLFAWTLQPACFRDVESRWPVLKLAPARALQIARSSK